jgi:hypothetical protein
VGGRSGQNARSANVAGATRTNVGSCAPEIQHSVGQSVTILVIIVVVVIIVIVGDRSLTVVGTHGDDDKGFSIGSVYLYFAQQHRISL